MLSFVRYVSQVSQEGIVMNERQQRFLKAYEADPRIAPAARAAKVHRASVYRWQADPAFAAAMEAASTVYYAAWKLRQAAQQELARREQMARNAALRPQRQAAAAHARASRGGQGQW